VTINPVSFLWMKLTPSVAEDFRKELRPIEKFNGKKKLRKFRKILEKYFLEL